MSEPRCRTCGGPVERDYYANCTRCWSEWCEFMALREAVTGKTKYEDEEDDA